MKTIVTITPLKLSKDSRAFKMVNSFCKHNYNSIAIEGIPSDFSKDELPFGLYCWELCDSKGTENNPTNIDLDSKDLHEHSIIKRIIKKLRKSSSVINSIVTFFGIYKSRLYEYYRLYKNKKIVKKIRAILDNKQVDIFYLHAQIIYLAPRLKKYYPQSKILYDAHDFYLDLLDRQDRNYNFYRNLFRKNEYRGISLTSKVTTVSNGIAENIFKEYNNYPDTIRNCQINNNNFGLINICKKLNLENNILLFIVITGAAKPGQIVIPTIEAFQYLPQNYHLAFLGSGYEIYLNEINNYNLNKRIHLVQPVKSNEIVNFIQSSYASLILYYPKSLNYKYALPNGFFQSVSAELPILYSEKLTEIHKIVTSYNMGIQINLSSPESIANKIKSLTQNKKFYNSLKENVCKAKQDLNWENEEKKLIEIIENL